MLLLEPDWEWKKQTTTLFETHYLLFASSGLLLSHTRCAWKILCATNLLQATSPVIIELGNKEQYLTWNELCHKKWPRVMIRDRSKFANVLATTVAVLANLVAVVQLREEPFCLSMNAIHQKWFLSICCVCAYTPHVEQMRHCRYLFVSQVCWQVNVEAISTCCRLDESQQN